MPTRGRAGKMKNKKFKETQKYFSILEVGSEILMTDNFDKKTLQVPPNM
jgi:hypothetical protein